MSFRHVNWVFANAAKHKWSTGLQIVLLSLADMMDASGKCYPGISCTAKRVSLSDKQTRRHIQTLKRLGLIKVIRNEKGGKPGQTPIYQALFTPSERSKNTTPPTDGSRRPPFNVPLDAPVCPIGLPSVAVDPSHPREPNHHRTTIEPSRNQITSFTEKGVSKKLSPWEQTLLKAERLGLKQDHARLESQGEFTKRVLSA